MALPTLATRLLNAVSVACAGFIVGQLWSTHLMPTGYPRQSENPPEEVSVVSVGAKISNIANLDSAHWGRARQTIVLVLSRQCAVCREGESFYRALIQHAKLPEIQVIAILNEVTAIPDPLLADVGIEAADRVEIMWDLRRMGVTVTPTLLLVDQQGVIRALWSGALTESQEKTLLAELGLDNIALDVAPKPQSDAGSMRDSELPLVSDTALHSVLLNAAAVVVDTRKREHFRLAHLAGAVNIPLDELGSRAWHELEVEAPLVIFCRDSAKSCPVSVRAPSKMGLCKVSHSVLSYLGFRDVTYIADDLSALRQMGVPIEGAPVR